MKALIFSTLLILFAAPLTACNTVEGFGQDIERAGEKIQTL